MLPHVVKPPESGVRYQTAGRGSLKRPLALAIALSGLYEGILLFTPLLDAYRFRTPYAIPLFDIPFSLVAIESAISASSGTACGKTWSPRPSASRSG